MIGAHNSQPQDNGLIIGCPTSTSTSASTSTSSSTSSSPPLVCPPPLAPSARERQRPCPSWPEQLPQAHSACQLARPSPRQQQLAGRVAGAPRATRLGPSLGWGAKGGGWVSGKKSLPHPPPFLPQEVRAREQRPQGALYEGVWGYPASSPGAHRLLRSGTLFPQASFRERNREPSLARALGRRGHGLPPPTPRTWPPASALPGCTPFSPARLTPARAWRRHGHFALAEGRGGRKRRGKGREGGRVAPDVTGVADERRPPLRRPPGPCLSLRFGSRSPGRLQVGGAEVPSAPALASLAVPRSPRGAPRLE